MIYDLIVCWEAGYKDVFTFTSEDAAKTVEAAFRKAWENEVKCTCIKKRVISF